MWLRHALATLPDPASHEATSAMVSTRSPTPIRDKMSMGLVAFEELARKVGREPLNDIVRAHPPNDFYESWVQIRSNVIGGK